MNIHKLFPSKWVGAADLDGATPTVIIKALTIEEVGAPPQNEEKPVLWFEKAQKGLILNKTNAMAIAAMYGPESDNWIGKKVQLYTAQVKAFGAVHDAIRVRSAGTVSAAPPPIYDAEPEDIADFDADELDAITVEHAENDTAASIGNGTDDNPFEDEPTSREQEVLDEWDGMPFSDIKQWLVDNGQAADLGHADQIYKAAKDEVGVNKIADKQMALKVRRAMLRNLQMTAAQPA